MRDFAVVRVALLAGTRLLGPPYMLYIDVRAYQTHRYVPGQFSPPVCTPFAMVCYFCKCIVYGYGDSSGSFFIACSAWGNRNTPGKSNYPLERKKAAIKRRYRKVPVPAGRCGSQKF